MQKKKYGIKEFETAVQLAFDTEVEGTFLEYLNERVLKTQAQLDVLHKQKKELECELSSLKAEKEYMERIKQILFLEITTLIRHKPYIERLFSFHMLALGLSPAVFNFRCASLEFGILRIYLSCINHDRKVTSRHFNKILKAIDSNNRMKESANFN